MTRKRARALRLAQEQKLNAAARNLPGVKPASVAEILAREAARPLRGGNAEPAALPLLGPVDTTGELFS